MDHLNEKCGIFGIFGNGMDVSRITFYGLFALQHRGQESSGIAASDGTRIAAWKKMGLVTQVYTEEAIASLTGHIAIGHNRYSTSKTSTVDHAQPIVILDDAGEPMLALAHNGNLPSVAALTTFLQEKGVQTDEKSDSRLMAEAVAWHLKNGATLSEAIKQSFPLFTGAFSLLVMTKDSLVALRDEFGIRPFTIGTLNGGTVFSSETCAFHTIGATILREVQPGEMVTMDASGMRSEQLAKPTQKLDIFEFVYFARPDSEMLGRSVYAVRRECGVRLAKEAVIHADMVVPVPETAIPVAAGYAEASGIPFEMALVKNRYIHRTFIQPEQHSRDLGVKLKLTPLPDVIKGKRVVLIDDSIVRGTTSRQLVKVLFEAGAAEVHFLVSSPPVMYPDFYGIDTPRQEDLIAARKTVEETREFLGATSLHYLSLQGLILSTGIPEDLFNTSCFTGEYPIDLKERSAEIHVPTYAPQEVPVGKLF